MSRRSNGEARCPRCRMHTSLCLCDRIPTLPTRTRLVLFLHHREDAKTTNTGRLATLCLPNSEVILRGVEGQEAARFEAPEGSRPLLLFPDEHATPLTEFVGSAEPITLIVPDGTWRQAAKVRHRVPGLADVTTVSLPPEGAETTYRLRNETREGGLATFEAIARAFGVLEGPDVERVMDEVFRTMVDRTLWSRGVIGADQIFGGVPPGAVRHDPRSGAGAR